jgi:hypothetical protein
LTREGLKNENNNKKDINDVISYNANIEILKNDMNLFKNMLNEIQKNHSNNEDKIFEKYSDILKSKIEYFENIQEINENKYNDLSKNMSLYDDKFETISGRVIGVEGQKYVYIYIYA